MRYILDVSGRDLKLIRASIVNFQRSLAISDQAEFDGLIDELGPSDVVVEKIAYSAFYMTRLEWVLEYLKIKDLVFGGIVTNGGVSSTVRDAHVRGYNCTVLSDGCAAFDNNVHQVSIQALESIARVVTCNNIISEMDK